ncbi:MULTISPECIES: hypothetical protein [unclassified Chelatococcus]|uniref:hypothetical protein n=1 Tax=unclassified Chelatococcus TaxID=2638111 RepID=UPI001BD00413|nr:MULTISPECIES: hypothetical protein [unclassified Chelatococcus]MBS7743470.1 hypothetical protein [Chelatococcus sp. HY11]
MQAIVTKFVPPLEPVGLLDRPRLRDYLGDLARHRLTIIKAAAGYGKTTLLAQWFDELKARGALCGWISLDTNDSSPRPLARSLQCSMPSARSAKVWRTYFSTRPISMRKR